MYRNWSNAFLDYLLALVIGGASTGQTEFYVVNSSCANTDFLSVLKTFPCNYKGAKGKLMACLKTTWG